MAIGERIKRARGAAGFSLRELATKTGVSHTAISNYEKGYDIPGSGVLLQLGRALDVPVEFFTRPSAISVGNLVFREHRKIGNKDRNTVKFQVQEWLERFLDAERLFTNKTAGFQLPRRLKKRTVKHMADTEEIALGLREEWEIGLGPIESIIELFEMKGIKVGLVPGTECFDACTFMLNNRVPVIAVKDDLPGDRQRFSLVHELGHIVLNTGEEVNVEKAIDRFAGAFLVPKQTVLAELGNKRKTLNLYEVHLLKHKYGLSMQGWIHRAEDLGVISQRAASRLRQCFKAQGWQEKEPGDQIKPEESKLMERWILRALYEDLISETRAAEMLGESWEQFWSEVSENHQHFPINLCD